MGDGVVDVVVAEVEVAADAEGEREGFGGDGGAEGGEAFGDDFWLVGPRAAGVGSADDVGDAVGDSHLAHSDGGFEVRGTVVEAEKKMVVDINHRWEHEGADIGQGIIAGVDGGTYHWRAQRRSEVEVHTAAEATAIDKETGDQNP